MLDLSFRHSTPQAEKTWRYIQQFFDELGLEAEALTVLSYVDPETGGRLASPVSRPLRDELETAAGVYVASVKFIADWRTTKTRKSLKANRDRVAKACADLAEINASRVLWSARDDIVTAIQLDLELEQVVIPHLERLSAYLSKQVDALGAYDPTGNKNASTREDDDYLLTLREIWSRIEAELDDKWRRKFMTLAAGAVFGGRSARKVENWFHKTRLVVNP